MPPRKKAATMAGTAEAKSKNPFATRDSVLAKAYEALSQDMRALVDSDEIEMTEEFVADRIVKCGVFEVDEGLLAQGGFVRSCIYELYGEESCYKTALMYRILGDAQKRYPDRRVAIVDSEDSSVPELVGDWMIANGLDPTKVLIIHPHGLDHAYRALVEICSSGLFSVVGWDSYAATMPVPSKEADAKAYRDKAFGSQRRMGSGPQANSEGLPLVKELARKHDVLVLVLNQVRSTFNPFKPGEKDSIGGMAMKHWMDVRLYLDAMSFIKDKEGADGRIIGREVRVEVTKSKIFPKGERTGKGGRCPHLRMFNDGSVGDRVEGMVMMGVELGLVKSSGSWLSWGDIKGQGMKSLAEAIKKARKVDEFWAAIGNARGTTSSDALRKLKLDSIDFSTGEIFDPDDYDVEGEEEDEGGFDDSDIR